MKRLPAWQVRGFQLLVPVFALVIGMLWFHEAPSARQLGGMLILFAGTGVIARGAWRDQKAARSP